LLVSQHGDSWSFPKGHIDSGESALETAKREIYEETGLKEVELIKELGTYTRFRIGKNGVGEDQNELKEITFFLFQTKKDELQPVDPDNPEAIWVAKDEVEKYLTHDKDKDFFRNHRKSITF
jgi:8-oxo-dGTP pyrophosphatase MutT (NUDIX family)